MHQQLIKRTKNVGQTEIDYSNRSFAEGKKYLDSRIFCTKENLYFIEFLINYFQL